MKLVAKSVECQELESFRKKLMGTRWSQESKNFIESNFLTASVLNNGLSVVKEIGYKNSL